MKHRFSKDQAFVFDTFPAKVDKITEMDTHAAQFIQKLRFVRGLVNGVCFQFHNDLIRDQQIGGVITDGDPLGLNLNFWFKLHFYAARLQFYLHGALINFFQKSKTENIVNFKCRAN